MQLLNAAQFAILIGAGILLTVLTWVMANGGLPPAATGL